MNVISQKQWGKWKPKKYLTQYYLPDIYAEDEKYILEYFIDFLKKLKRTFSKVIEIGSGPTIHHAIPLVPYADKIILTDYLRTNLFEINHWLNQDPGAHNWDIYFEHILKYESCRKPDYSAIKRRKEECRKKICLAQLDIRNLINSEVYPLVTAFYCADSITNNKDEWKKYMLNLFKLVEPSGWCITSALRNASFYRVGKEYYPSPNINENDYIKIFRENGFKIKTIRVSVHPIKMWTKEGFNAIIISIGQKK